MCVSDLDPDFANVLATNSTLKYTIFLVLGHVQNRYLSDRFINDETNNAFLIFV